MTHPLDHQGWPELPREPPELENLAEGASPIELARGYASAYLAFAPLWRRAVHALEWLYGAMMGSKAQLEQLQIAVMAQRLPPMRAPMSSTHEVARTVGGDVAEAYAAEQRNPSTPPVVPPDKIKALVEERVAIEIARLKAAEWDRIEAERKAAESDRLAIEKQAESERRDLERAAAAQRIALAAENARQRANWKWATLSACVTTALGVGAFLVEHCGKR